eukprot:CCRYP_002596-RA/>CCRYP_002596-RA protein AED:0.49 eAED:0.49 QI:0/-1/0/1/-1/0/1/0/16
MALQHNMLQNPTQLQP